MCTECHPELEVGVDTLVVPAILLHRFEHVMGCFIEVGPGQILIVDDGVL